MHMMIRGPDGRIYDLSTGSAREVSLTERHPSATGGPLLPYLDENNAMIATMEDTSHSIECFEENNAMIATMEDTSHSVEFRA